MSIFKLPLITALFFGLIISCGKPESDPDKGKTNPQPQVVGVTSVSIDKTSLSLTEGESATLTATVKPDNATNKTVSWSSSNSSVATVDAAGKVSAVAEGTATITAKAGEKSATCSVSVTKKAVAVESITLNKSSLELKAGETATLTATVKPDNATNKTVSWSSSNSSVATVDAAGKVSAVAEGTATITAKAGDKTATCTVTVKKNVVDVESITLDKTSLELKEGETATLIATVNPDNATNKAVTWSSDKTSVATVNASGKVTAVAEGTATITAKAGGKTATCIISVKKAGMSAGDPEGFNNENGEW
ncbi:MAG: Ig domain-containing protein [Bacteroidales bacterium]|nr:Ig domain-containing protein [Bacteroidales bacterium]